MATSEAKTGKGKAASYSAPAVDMALDIVEYLAEHPETCGINELARRLEIPVNSVYRILMRLSERGYVETDTTTGGYQLSTRLFSLGMRLQSRFELRSRARPHLERLSAATGETCQIQALQGTRMMVVDCVAPPTAFFLHVVPGSLVYCHANAFGKAQLAFLPDDHVAAVFDDGLPALTEATRVDPAAVRRELAGARRTGLAYDREEYSKGIYCVGAPVFDVSGAAVAGLGMTGLASRFASGEAVHVQRLVLECAAAVAAAIGYQGEAYRQWLDELAG